MITARPGSNSTSIPILTEVLELPTQLATPLPVVPAELVPQHLAPEPVEPPLPEPLVMRTRGAGGPAEFSARVVDAAGLSAHAVAEPPLPASVAGMPAAGLVAESPAAAAQAAVEAAVSAAVEAVAPGAVEAVVPAAVEPVAAPVAAKSASSAPAVAASVSSVVTPLFANADGRPVAPPQPAAPAVDLDALADRLRAEVLADLREQIEPALRARMLQRLEPVLRTALADISQSLQQEIGTLVDEAVEKVLIRHVTTLD